MAKPDKAVGFEPTDCACNSCHAHAGVWSNQIRRGISNPGDVGAIPATSMMNKYPRTGLMDYKKAIPDDVAITTGSVDIDEFDSVSYRANPMISGHPVRFNEGSVECRTCDFEEEVPDIIKRSSGFRQVVYKLVLVSELQSIECIPSADPPPKSATEPITYDPNTIYTTNTTTTKSEQLVKDEIAKGLSRNRV